MTKGKVSYNLYLKLKESITDNTLKPGSLLPSENQLCQLHKVSRVTVRAALKMLESDQLITPHAGRGWQVCDLQPNTPTKTQRVLFCSKAFQSQAILTGIKDIFNKYNIDCTFLPYAQDELIKSLSFGKFSEYAGCDGLIFFTDAPLLPQACTLLKKLNIPIICLGLYEHTSFDTICCDFYEGTRSLVNYLHQNNFRNIAYMGQDQMAVNHPSFRYRELGYKQTMEDLQLVPNFLILKPGYDVFLDTPDLVKEWLDNSRKNDNYPQCIIMSNCEHLNSLSRILNQLDIKIPEDISLCSIGTAGEPIIGNLVNFEKLTVFEEPWLELGKTAAWRMLSRLQGCSSTPSLTLVPSTVIEGDSTLLK